MVSPSSALAATHTLQPYAYVQSHGVNRIATGYCAKGTSRYFIDFQMLDKGTDAQGIFGGTAENPMCAFYTTNGDGKRNYRWYYKNSGSSGDVTFNAIDENRRCFTATHSSTTQESSTLSLYDRTGSSTISKTYKHSGTATTPLNLFALGNKSYVAGSKRIYCFEAADDSDAVQPTAFLAPANESDEAGFYDVVGGTFHGEAESNVADAKKLTYSDGVGSADDYKYEDGVLSAKFYAYAADDATGGVKFGEGEASGTAEAWVERGESIALSAIPAAGYVFLGWTGDTWAITAGAMSDETVTVASGTAVQLLAHFGEEALRWTGAAGDGVWFTPGNWKDASGNAATALSSGDKFAFVKPGAQTVDYNPSDASFAIGSLTFGPAAGAVTVTGDAMASLGKIVCANGAENTMANAVAFKGDIDVSATSGLVRFSGGATGSGIANHTDFYGKYTISKSGDWNPPDGSTLKSGSELNLPNGTYYDHNARLTIEAGATATVRKTKTDGADDKYLLQKNSGVFKATEEIYSDTKKAGGYMEKSSGGGLYFAGKLRTTASLILPLSQGRTIVGEGGIIHGADGYVRVFNSGSHYLGASADWCAYFNNHNNSATVKKGIRKTGGTSMTTLTFDTTDYYDSAVGRTITMETGIGGDTSAVADKFAVVVQGIGDFVFANTGIDDKDFGGGLTVKDSAKVSVKIGARPGKGAVALSDRSTLEVAASGTVTLGGKLTLGENSNLAFNFTQRDVAPALGGTAATAAGESVNVKVSSTDGLRPKGGTYALTSGMDFSGKTVNLVDKPEWVRGASVVNGDIVLSVKRGGFAILIK